MLELAQKYAETLCKAVVLAHRIHETGKEITFVLSTGPKLTMTESQLKLALQTKTDAVGTVADGEPQPSAPSTAQSAETKTKKKKE
jgi:hypothetical protein